MPDLLRATGAGGRGRPPAARDDTAAREEISGQRRERTLEHDEALREAFSTGRERRGHRACGFATRRRLIGVGGVTVTRS
ncbi:hypothetical protein B0293_04710 [Amycolatopsis azurea DSM 43854]|uniref:Uncharacterized protein n=1 Tax=Amycolatopsis azurea DSM 43854 TaxID=1238180 RepID=A0ABX3JMS3_9PSEU|nr:hypothetical protein B0293_04710 [Amycolatopsis azurea DSM 43854]